MYPSLECTTAVVWCGMAARRLAASGQAGGHVQAAEANEECPLRQALLSAHATNARLVHPAFAFWLDVSHPIGTCPPLTHITNTTPHHATPHDTPTIRACRQRGALADGQGGGRRHLHSRHRQAALQPRAPPPQGLRYTGTAPGGTAAADDSGGGSSAAAAARRRARSAPGAGAAAAAAGAAGCGCRVPGLPPCGQAGRQRRGEALHRSSAARPPAQRCTGDTRGRRAHTTLSTPCQHSTSSSSSCGGGRSGRGGVPPWRCSRRPSPLATGRALHRRARPKSPPAQPAEARGESGHTRGAAAGAELSAGCAPGAAGARPAAAGGLAAVQQHRDGAAPAGRGGAGPAEAGGARASSSGGARGRSSGSGGPGGPISSSSSSGAGGHCRPRRLAASRRGAACSRGAGRGSRHDPWCQGCCCHPKGAAEKGAAQQGGSGRRSLRRRSRHAAGSRRGPRRGSRGRTWSGGARGAGCSATRTARAERRRSCFGRRCV